MYIPKIVYDSSCNYQGNKFHASVMENALFDLTKDYIYVVENSDNCINVSGKCEETDEN